MSAQPKTDLVAAEEPMDPMSKTLAIIERLALDPTVDVGKMQAMLDLQMQIIDKQAQMDYNAAMIRLQDKLSAVKILKGGKISFEGKAKDGSAYKQETPYAKLEDIDKVLRPLMRDEGFAVTYLTEGTDRVVVKCKITHKGGHSEISTMQLPLDTSGSKNNLQGAGSSISYGRRYTLCAMLNLITHGEDDDAMGGCIDAAQAEHIKGLIKESGADTKQFLKYMKAENVESIAFKDYRRATHALEEKLNKGKAVKNA